MDEQWPYPTGVVDRIPLDDRASEELVSFADRIIGMTRDGRVLHLYRRGDLGSVCGRAANSFGGRAPVREDTWEAAEYPLCIYCFRWADRRGRD